VNAATGAELWHGQVSAFINHSSPVVAGGALYIGTEQRQMYAFALP